MSRKRARILVLEPERGTAEAILRGLDAITEIRAEVDLVATVTAAIEELDARSYELLVVTEGLAGGLRRVLHAEDAEDSVDGPVRPRGLLSVGGAPNGSQSGKGDALRVPLPLSFNLLRLAVLSALDGRGQEQDWDEPRLRDTADG